MNNPTMHKSRKQKRTPSKKVPKLDEGAGNMFASLIWSHPELWSQKHIDHGNQPIKDQAWAEVAANIPGWTAGMAIQNFTSSRTLFK